MIAGIPLPTTDGPSEAEFWAGLKAGELRHQHCVACDAWHFPARWRCICGNELYYRGVSGRATLWSWTQVHPPVLPAFAPFTPFIVGIAQLEEAQNLRMVGSLIIQPSDPINRVQSEVLRPDMPLRACIIQISSDVAWPAWQLC